MSGEGGMGGGGFGGGMPGSPPNANVDAFAVDETAPPGATTTPQPRDGNDSPRVPILNKIPYASRHHQKQKGSARLSVNVNLDVPADYQTREFVSVADSVHRPSMLSLVVQRRGQISAIRLVAALIVILLAWRMRSASLLWKLTLAITMLLVALGLSPLLSNAWQSVVDGLALGALLSVLMAMVCGCLKCCECPWTWLKRRMVSAV